jgi:sodium transport system permease protein
MNKVFLLFKKEMREAIRDSRTFLICIIIPFVLYPVLFITMGFFLQIEEKKEAGLIYGVGAVNPSLMPDLFAHIDTTEKFEVLKGNEPLVMFKKDKVKIVLEVKENNDIVIYYDGASKSSRKALKRIDALISEFKDSMIKGHMHEIGLSETILTPFSVSEMNIAPAKKMGGFILGIIIPYLLLILAFQGAMHAAAHTTAGEKERKTIETLLVTDIKRSEIILGKCLLTFTLALLATVAGLLGLIVTMQSGISLVGTTAIGFSLAVPWLSCILILITMLPLIWFFSSVLVAIGTIVFFIPVLNNAVLQQQILIGETKGLDILITVGSCIIYAMLAYLFAKRSFEKEEILLRS